MVMSTSPESVLDILTAFIPSSASVISFLVLNRNPKTPLLSNFKRNSFPLSAVTVVMSLASDSGICSFNLGES